MDSIETFTFYQSDLQNVSFLAFEDMRKKEELCDLTIRAGDNTLFAHRVILAAAIPYFRSFLTGNQTNVEEKEIGDLDPGALESLIDFAYSSKVTLTDDNVQSVLVAAEFLELKQVEDACVEFLSKRLNNNNVIQVRNLALSFNIFKLAEISDRYIRQNFENLSKSDDFLNMTAAHVKEIISKDDLNVSNEEIVFEAVMNWVKFTPSERKVKLPELLTEVRMVFLPTDYLIKNVSSEELIRTSFQCRDLVENVKGYHLLSKEESFILNLKTQPRKRRVNKSILYGICSSSPDVCSLYYCDFTRQTWNKITSKEVQEDGIHCVAATNESIYVFFQNTIQEFDLETRIWHVLEPMHERIDGAAVVPYGSNIYCFGSSGGGFGDKVRRFDTRSKTWLPEDRMTTRRSYCAATTMGDGIYVTGGLYYVNEILDTVERYSPSTRECTECSPMVISRYYHGCACHNGKIYICGGITNCGPSYSAEVYDPMSNLGCFISYMMTERRCFSLIPYNNKIYALGGFKGDGKSYLDSEIYDSRQNKWKSGFSVPEGFQYAVLL